MASRGKKRPSLPNDGDSGLLSRLSHKLVPSDAAVVTKKLLHSTGKAAWIAGTTFLVLIVPLIIEMDREQQLTELELQQASLLGAPAVSK